MRPHYRFDRDDALKALHIDSDLSKPFVHPLEGRGRCLKIQKDCELMLQFFKRIMGNDHDDFHLSSLYDTVGQKWADCYLNEKSMKAAIRDRIQDAGFIKYVTEGGRTTHTHTQTAQLSRRAQRFGRKERRFVSMRRGYWAAVTRAEWEVHFRESE